MKELEAEVEKEGFASRWSRRKQQLKAEQQAPGPEQADPEEPTEHEIAVLGKKHREQDRAEKLAQLNDLSDEDMPDIATLNEDSDFSQFMSTSVSETLRKQALHKLFHGAGYNIRDGLDEYDGDYTYFEKLDPGTITADMKYRLELEAEKLKAKLTAEAEAEAEDKAAEALDAPAEDTLEVENQTAEPAGNEDESEARPGAAPQIPDEQEDIDRAQQSDVSDPTEPARHITEITKGEENP